MNSVLFLQFPGEGLARPILTVSEHDARLAGSDRAEPVQEVGLAGMRAEASQGMDLGSDGHFFAVNAHLLFTFHQSAAQ